MTEFKDKFIAFVDVLGFKDLVARAERGEGRSASQLRNILAKLENDEEKRYFKTNGPRICPNTSSLNDDLDFESTQVSDCVIASAELSALGAINLVHFCWSASLELLNEGLMVRGYITRGLIHHRDSQFMGTGYQHAYHSEQNVDVFKRKADERGTPFIELDPEVLCYIRERGDACIQKMFHRYVKFDGKRAAIFPFKPLNISFVTTGFDVSKVNAAELRARNDSLRATLKDVQKRVLSHIDPTNKSARQKAEHYVAALNEQIDICNRTAETIAALS